MKILICDDSAPLRAALSRALELSGHGVESVAGGIEALDALGSAQFDAVLLDIDMPVMSGWDLAAAIRALPHGGAVRIVMLSARDEAEDRARSLASGADAHVTKPASLAQVQDALTRPFAPAPIAPSPGRLVAGGDDPVAGIRADFPAAQLDDAAPDDAFRPEGGTSLLPLQGTAP